MGYIVAIAGTFTRLALGLMHPLIQVIHLVYSNV
jgi:hypothetical protein